MNFDSRMRLCCQGQSKVSMESPLLGASSCDDDGDDDEDDDGDDEKHYVGVNVPS